MRWPRRQWAVTRYYFGVSTGVARRCWTRRAAERIADASNFAEELAAKASKTRQAYTYKVGRREPW